MNKNEFASAVADKSGLSKDDASKAVEAVLDTITEQMKKGEEVRLLGFGNFSATRREAREGRNPQTGGTVQIAASNVPKFKAGKGLKDALNS